MDRARGAARLPPEVNRVLYVRNLPFKTEESLSTEEIYDIFGKRVAPPSENRRRPPRVRPRVAPRVEHPRVARAKDGAASTTRGRPRYGAIRQIRIGNRPDTRGTAFVVYEDIYDAKNAVDHLSGFNVGGRYLIVLYYQAARMAKRTESLEQKRAELEALKRRAA